MNGLYRHNIDAKGRLSIPARLREELGDVFYVTISTEKCLCAYPLERWNALQEKIRGMKMSERHKVRAINAYAARCELDLQGRILLPQELRDFAGLKKGVTIVGNSDWAELWDEDTWNEMDSVLTTPENIAAAFRELDL